MCGYLVSATEQMYFPSREQHKNGTQLLGGMRYRRAEGGGGRERGDAGGVEVVAAAVLTRSFATVSW